MSDAQAELQIVDRRTFGRFLGIDGGDAVPDETTIWRSREALVRTCAVETLFARFDARLKSAGYLVPLSDCSVVACRAVMGWQIVDASIVAAPRPRMTDTERDIATGGGIPEGWKAKSAKLNTRKNLPAVGAV
ncbi:MAG: transposase [Pseudomonadota bacterium]